MFNRLFSLVSKKKVTSIKLKVNHKEIEVAKGTLVIDAIKKAGFDVPTMCYHPDLPTSGGICRVCVVGDLKNPNVPIISCMTQVREGMKLDTTLEKMKMFRQANGAMMFNYHPTTCLTCANAHNCDTKDFAALLNFRDSPFKSLIYAGQKPDAHSVGKAFTSTDLSSNIQKIDDLCINCDRCIYACEHLEGIGCYGWVADHDAGHVVGAFGPSDLNECVQCGQCINRCPTGALSEKGEIEDVLAHINNKKKMVVFQTAPAIRVAIAEEFGYEPGEKMAKNELAQGLKMLGSQHNNVFVCDTNFTADLTIMEEGTEFLGRLTKVLKDKVQYKDQKESPLPLFTSCSPGWIDYIEKNYPEYLNKVSSCKSPQQMMGAVIKSYWVKHHAWEPKDVVTVSIMPCSAKKLEKDRGCMNVDGLKDIDHVLTTRECAKMLKERNIDISKLPGQDFDHPLGHGSGAAVIFGATGGVMEAALRTAYFIITGKEVPFKNFEITPVRGMEGVKEAKIPIAETVPEWSFLKGATVSVAIAHGLANAKIVMEKLRECDEKNEPYPWHFVEVMACPGGCLGGGGQPKPTSMEIRNKRMDLIYQEDRDLPTRQSHENPEVTQIYKEFLDAPNSEKAHHLLHTHYSDRTVDYSKFVDMSKADEYKSYLAKFPAKKSEYIVEMLHSIVDKYNYVDDCAAVCIAQQAGVKPIAVIAAASSYFYIPLSPVGENVLWCCTCQNCQMKGAKELQENLQNHFGIKMGETTSDGKVTLMKTNWLGWCVNDAPAIMLKKQGSDKLITITGALKKDPATLLDCTDEFPEQKIRVMPYTRVNEGNLSFFNEINLKSAVDKALTMGGQKLCGEIKKSGLQGRGGAGFPTHIKWSSAMNEESTDKYVVVNIDEGLPSTFKDWVLLNEENGRQKMIAGMCICAQTIGAKKAYVYLRYEYRNLKQQIESSIDTVKALHPKFADISFETRLGGGPYVAGEETALFESIEGKAPRPRTDRNAFPTQKGVFSKPTIINNVETFAAIPHIALEGGDKWGAVVGASGEKGVKLYGVCGDVEPSVVEYPVGVSFQSILDDVKGLNIVAAECGGMTEKIITKPEFDKVLSFKQGEKSVNGVGSIVLYNDERNIGKIYEHKLEFMAEESCKQCVPCREGTKILSEAFSKDIEGAIRIADNTMFAKLAETIEATSICAHGKVAGTLFKHAAQYLEK